MLDAAGRSFRTKGFAGTSMTAVAGMAGISTRTIYRLIPTKAELLQAVVEAHLDRFLPAFGEDAPDAAGFPAALERMLAAYGALALSLEAVAISRLILGECRRFPEPVRLFLRATGRIADAMTAWLGRHRDRGLLMLGDAALAGDMLRGMMAMEPQRATMLGLRPVLGTEEIAERARYCARIFLEGCVTRRCRQASPRSGR